MNFGFFRNFETRLWRGTFNFRWQLFSDILQKMPNSCFLNNHFCPGLMENMDIQPVFNHCKAVACICAYLSKSESECNETSHETSSLECIYEETEQLWANEISC